MAESHSKPIFIDWKEYYQWRTEWKIIIKILDSKCKERKLNIRLANKQNNWDRLKQLREKYQYDKAMVTKMITLFNEAKIRWKNIKSMYKSIQDQYRIFPLEIKDVRIADFYFNKKHLEFPKIPMWILTAKGATYYINSLNSKIGFSTKEKVNHPSTKAMIRFNKQQFILPKKVM